MEMQIRSQRVQDMMVRKWKDSTRRAAQKQQEGWWTRMRFSTVFQSCALMQETSISMLRKTRMPPARLREKRVKRYHARGGRVVSPCWILNRQLYGKWKAAKKFNEFVVAASDGRNQAVSRAAITLQTTTNHIDLRVSPRRLLRVRSHVDLVWLQENFGARLRVKPAEPMGPRSQYSYVRPTGTRIDADTVHIAPRETCIKNVLDILDLGDNKCQVQTDADPECANAAEKCRRGAKTG